MNTILLDPTLMPDRQTAHQYIASMLDFPPYYGGNLDALADCLGDLPGDVTIVMQNPELLETNLGTYGKRLIDVFAAVSQTAAFRFEIDPND